MCLSLADVTQVKMMNRQQRIIVSGRTPATKATTKRPHWQRFLPPSLYLDPSGIPHHLGKRFPALLFIRCRSQEAVKNPGVCKSSTGAAKLKSQVMEGVPHLRTNLAEVHFQWDDRRANKHWPECVRWKEKEVANWPRGIFKKPFIAMDGQNGQCLDWRSQI